MRELIRAFVEIYHCKYKGFIRAFVAKLILSFS